MPKLTIDQREIEVPPGTTVLAAARQLGIEIPTLCYWEGCEASTSCLVCVVKINGNHRLVPACATLVENGMQVESETPEVHAARRTALELLLSDHLGDCLAPCWFGCPARMDIPQMLRQIAAGDLRSAIATVKRDIALPAVLGRICPAPCEKTCRRRGLDGAVAICLLKRYVADVDFASGDPYLPPCRPSTGKRVAIVGGGSTGLAAAYYLAQAGHACTIFEAADRLGGRLWTETTPHELPRKVLQAEIDQITRLGVEVLLNQTIDPHEMRIVEGRELKVEFRPSTLDSRPSTFDPRPSTLDPRPSTLDPRLSGKYHAFFLACGTQPKGSIQRWGLPAGPRGIQVDPETFLTERPGVFAAGNVVRGRALVVRSVADGKEAAVAIDQCLRGLPVTGPEKPFTTKIGRLDRRELQSFSAGSGQTPRREPARGFSHGYAKQEVVAQATRCLHCDCRGLTTCKLRKYAARYHANPKRFAAKRRLFQQDRHHPDVIFEPGKCIACGLCIQIAAREGEKIGFSFVGRGFDVRVAVPLHRHLSDALTKAAASCVAACPTAALAWKKSS
jgi:ferredoxin